MNKLARVRLKGSCLDHRGVPARPKGVSSGVFFPVQRYLLGQTEGQFLRIMALEAGGITSVHCPSVHGVDYFLLFFCRVVQAWWRRSLWAPSLSAKVSTWSVSSVTSLASVSTASAGVGQKKKKMKSSWSLGCQKNFSSSLFLSSTLRRKRRFVDTDSNDDDDVDTDVDDGNNDVDAKPKLPFLAQRKIFLILIKNLRRNLFRFWIFTPGRILSSCRSVSSLSFFENNLFLAD